MHATHVQVTTYHKVICAHSTCRRREQKVVVDFVQQLKSQVLRFIEDTLTPDDGYLPLDIFHGDTPTTLDFLAGTK